MIGLARQGHPDRTAGQEEACPQHVKHGDDGSRGSPVFRQGTRSLRWEGVAPRKLLLREDPVRVFHRRPDRGHPVEVDAGPMADPRLENHLC